MVTMASGTKPRKIFLTEVGGLAGAAHACCPRSYCSSRSSCCCWLNLLLLSGKQESQQTDAHHGQHCSHRVIVLNQMAKDETVRVWPGFVLAANNMMTLTERAGDRGLVGGVFQESEAWSRSVFPPRVPKSIYKQWMKDVMTHYAEGGLTMIASSLEEGDGDCVITFA